MKQENNENKRLKAKNIISASRRTDIPAFYYEWLQDALKKGSVDIANPRFPNVTYTVDLKPDNVHSIVLWSKNFINVLNKPMMLDNYNLYFQYTINNYSSLLEPHVPDYHESIKILDGMLKKYKPEQFNIRFDPVIISTNGEPFPTPDKPEYARLNAFSKLCNDLKLLGMEKSKITTSYIDFYGHVKKRLEQSGLDYIYLNNEQQITFFERMSEIAYKYSMSLYSCADPILEKVSGIKKGRCIDGDLLIKLFGGKVKTAKDKGQRVACSCSSSRDIGIYAKNNNGMICNHYCIYCYVNH